MTQRVDVRSDDGLVLLNQLYTNVAMRRRVWEKAAAGRKVTITPSKPPAPKPPPAPVAPYGTKADAGVFAGRGIMLGSNPDVWGQAHDLADHLEVVASIPAASYHVKSLFKDTSVRVVEWCPPEVKAVSDIMQAESQAEWNAGNHLAPGICANSWTYGRFDNRVALVEAYFNEGWGVDFGIFINYTAQGAKAVIPVCGGYHAAGRSDAESARLYEALGKLPFPGFWMYAGESMLTAESVEVLKAWKPS